MSEPTGRVQRADAVRNRAKILQAAQEQITARGPDVGMTEIASAAGVAVGTLYRHFPTKTDLVAAVMAGYVDDVASDVRAALARVGEGRPALEEIIDFLKRVTESSAKNHAVKAAAAGLGIGQHGDGASEAKAAQAVGQLLGLAQHDGQIDPSVTVADIYLLVSTAPVDQPAQARERWLELVIPGLLQPRAGQG